MKSVYEVSLLNLTVPEENRHGLVMHIMEETPETAALVALKLNPGCELVGSIFLRELKSREIQLVKSEIKPPSGSPVVTRLKQMKSSGGNS